MKKYILMESLWILAIAAIAQEKKMTWTTKSPAAKELASKGVDRFQNVELPQALDYFTQAVKLDPDFTVALVFMANLTSGSVQKSYQERAVKSAKNKTAGEKLFASIVDRTDTVTKFRDKIAKLHEMFPDGQMLSYFHYWSREKPEERFAAAKAHMAKFPKDAAVHNFLGYYYLSDAKDTVEAKRQFEKYIAMYPDGINPYDSMGEFYMLTGDMENSRKYYALALEKYPFNNSSVNAIQKLDELKTKSATAVKGN